MSNSTIKKTALALFGVIIVVTLIFVKPQQGYFNSVGNLIQSKLEPSGAHGQNSLDLKKLRPDFYQGR